MNIFKLKSKWECYACEDEVIHPPCKVCCKHDWEMGEYCIICGADWNVHYCYERGFTLIELLVCLVILGIVAPYCNSFILKLAKLQKLQVQGQSRVVSVGNTCISLDGIYYTKASGADSISLYTNASCTGSIGGLDRLSNPSWFNETTKSSWLVFSNGGLKVVVIRYN